MPPMMAKEKRNRMAGGNADVPALRNAVMSRDRISPPVAAAKKSAATTVRMPLHRVHIPLVVQG